MSHIDQHLCRCPRPWKDWHCWPIKRQWNGRCPLMTNSRKISIKILKGMYWNCKILLYHFLKFLYIPLSLVHLSKISQPWFHVPPSHQDQNPAFPYYDLSARLHRANHLYRREIHKCLSEAGFIWIYIYLYM